MVGCAGMAWHLRWRAAHKCDWLVGRVATVVTQSRGAKTSTASRGSCSRQCGCVEQPHAGCVEQHGDITPHRPQQAPQALPALPGKGAAPWQGAGRQSVTRRQLSVTVTPQPSHTATVVHTATSTTAAWQTHGCCKLLYSHECPGPSLATTYAHRIRARHRPVRDIPFHPL